MRSDETCSRVGSNQWPSDQKSSTLPLDYCTRRCVKDMIWSGGVEDLDGWEYRRSESPVTLHVMRHRLGWPSASGSSVNLHANLLVVWRVLSLCGERSCCVTYTQKLIQWDLCSQETPQYPRETVPSSQVSLHHRCPFITGVPSSQVSLHHRCPFITGVPSSQVSLHHRCPFITGSLTCDEKKIYHPSEK